MNKTKVLQLQYDLEAVESSKARVYAIRQDKNFCRKCGDELELIKVPAVNRDFTGSDIIEYETTDLIEVCPSGCLHYEMITGESLPVDSGFEVDYIPF